MGSFVDSLRVSFDFSLYFFLEFESFQTSFRGDFLPQLQVLTLIERKGSSSPFPLELAFAPAVGLVEEAA